MSVSLSKKQLTQAHDRLQGMRNRIARVKQEAEATTEKVVRTAEVGGSAFAFGVLSGRTDGIELLGVPLELAAGIALNLGGYFGVAGKMSDHLNNIGDGALAAYLVTMGHGIGAEWRIKEKGEKKKVSISSGGMRTSIGAGGLTPDEIAQAVAEGAMAR